MRILSYNMGGMLPTIQYLKDAGFLIDEALDEDDALSLLSLGHEYEALIYGDAFARKVRNHGSDIPLICFTGKQDADFTITELTNGGDCVLKYPVVKKEALAFIKATIRRCHLITSEVRRYGPLTVNFETQQVFVNKKEVYLTATEFKVFACLARHYKTCVALESIYFHVYQDDKHADSTKLIDVYACKINKKLRKVLGFNVINSVWGRGRVLDAEKSP